MLFLVYINNLPDAIKSYKKLFANDIKLFSNVCINIEIDRLESNLQSIKKWSDDWQMVFKINKCSVLQLRHKNTRHNYKCKSQKGNVKLGHSISEKDLGIIMDPQFDFSSHTDNIASWANHQLGLIID